MTFSVCIDNTRMRNRPSPLRLLTDLLFPQCCAGCSRTLLSEGDTWCQDCAKALLAATHSDFCLRCGLNVGPYLKDSAGCQACRQYLHNPLDGMVRVAPYNSLVGELVRKYKYGRQQRLDRPLGSLLADAIQGQAWASEIDALLPVPATLASRFRYRFHPVALIADRVGRKLALPVYPLVYVRGKKRKQVDLPESERVKNVKGVFHVSRHAQINGTRLCVIDDVCTSGSTLREVARVLKKAGAAKIYGAVLAKTDPSEFYLIGA